MLIHRLFPDPTLLENMFLMNKNYPVTMDWYLFTLEWKTCVCMFWWVIYQYAKEESRAEKWAAFTMLGFWVKEIPEYALFANQTSALYDILCIFGILFILMAVHFYDRLKSIK